MDLDCRTHMPSNCSADYAKVVEHVDQVFTFGTSSEKTALKNQLGMANITHLDDVAGTLRYPLWDWQSLQVRSLGILAHMHRDQSLIPSDWADSNCSLHQAVLSSMMCAMLLRLRTTFLRPPADGALHTPFLPLALILQVTSRMVRTSTRVPFLIPNN